MRYLLLLQDSGAGVENGLVQVLCRWKASLERFDAADCQPLMIVKYGAVVADYLLFKRIIRVPEPGDPFFSLRGNLVRAVIDTLLRCSILGNGAGQ